MYDALQQMMKLRSLMLLSPLLLACGSEVRDDALDPNGPPPPSVEGVNNASVQLLADGLDNPYGIAVDDSRIYVSTHETDYDGDIISLPLEGGVVTDLAGSQHGPYVDSVELGHVYWGTWYDGVVRRVAVDGGPVGDVISHAPEVPVSVAVEGAEVYSTILSSGDVLSAPADGTSMQTIATKQSKPNGIAKDGDDLYWFNTCDGGIMTMPANGGTSSLFAPTQPAAAGSVVSVHDGYIYWVDGTNEELGSIHRVPLEAGVAEVVADAELWPSSVVVDDSGVYWANWDEGTINWASHDGSESEVIVSGLTSSGGGAVTIAVDETHIYFTNRDAGQVLRTDKP
jgi:hypothetical protein